MSLRGKLALASLFIAVLSGAILVYFIFANSRAALEQMTFQHLTGVTALKESEFQRWLAAGEDGLRSLARRPLVIEGAEALLELDRHSIQYAILTNDLREIHFLPALTDGCCFKEISLIRATDGQIVVSTESSLMGVYRESETYFTRGQVDTFVQDPTYDLQSQGVVMHISTPVVNQRGQVIAVLIGNLNLNEMTAIMRYATTLNDTHETYLVDAFNFFVTESRFMPDVAFQKTIYTEGVTRCLKGENGTGTYPDYRGIQVMGAFRWMAEPGLCIVTEIDASEALAIANTLRDTTIQIGGLVGLVAVAVSWLLSRSFIRPITRLVKATQAVAQGNLHYHIEEEGNDEIGQLTRSFNQMITNLNTVTASRDELNQEMTERKRVEAALRESETRFRSAFELAAIGRALIGLDGTFMLVNPSLCQMLGYDQTELLDKTWKDITCPDDIAIGPRAVKQLLNGEAPAVEFEYRICHRDGHVIWTFLSIVLIRDIDGHPLYMGVDCEDVSWRKQVEMALTEKNAQLARSNEELQQFAYVASHDLQEPLRMVTSYLQLLEKRYQNQLDEDAHEFIDYAVDGARRMKQLINDLLAYSRVGTHGKPLVPTDMKQVLDRVLHDLQINIAESDAVITYDTLPTVIGDEGQLAQVFQNLLGNAIKFRSDVSPHIHVSVTNGAEEWQFGIRDNGIGIEPKFHNRVFEIFERLHTRGDYSGTGIGLAVCKKIIQRHGGRIWIESQFGQGATFYFTIPKKQGRDVHGGTTGGNTLG